MTQITIEIPDSLAKRLVSVQDRLPEVLARWLDEPPPPSNEVYRYVLAFLATNPSPQEILDFSLTSAMQERASDLLEKNRSGKLTSVESAELDEYVHINRSPITAQSARLTVYTDTLVMAKAATTSALRSEVDEVPYEVSHRSRH